MKLKNPAFPASEKAAEHAAAVADVITASGQPVVTADEIRAALPDVADDLPDAVLEEVARLIGASVC